MRDFSSGERSGLGVWIPISGKTFKGVKSEKARLPLTDVSGPPFDRFSLIDTEFEIIERHAIELFAFDKFFIELVAPFVDVGLERFRPVIDIPARETHPVCHAL